MLAKHESLLQIDSVNFDGFGKACPNYNLQYYVKPFEEPQRSVKIKINLSFYFNTTFRNVRDVKG